MNQNSTVKTPGSSRRVETTSESADAAETSSISSCSSIGQFTVHSKNVTDINNIGAGRLQGKWNYKWGRVADKGANDIAWIVKEKWEEMKARKAEKMAKKEKEKAEKAKKKLEEANKAKTN